MCLKWGSLVISVVSDIVRMICHSLLFFFLYSGLVQRQVTVLLSIARSEQKLKSKHPYIHMCLVSAVKKKRHWPMSLGPAFFYVIWACFIDLMTHAHTHISYLFRVNVCSSLHVLHNDRKIYLLKFLNLFLWLCLKDKHNYLGFSLSWSVFLSLNAGCF